MDKEKLAEAVMALPIRGQLNLYLKALYGNMPLPYSQDKEVRQAFVAGMEVMYAKMMSVTQLADADAEKALSTIHDDIRELVQEIGARENIKRGN